MTRQRSRRNIRIITMLLSTLALLAVACGSAEDTVPDRENTSEPIETTAPDAEASTQDDISAGTSLSVDPESATPEDPESSTVESSTTTVPPPTTSPAPPALFGEGDTIPGFPQGHDAIPNIVSKMSLSVGDGKAVFDMADGAAPAYDDVTYVCLSSDGCGIDDQLVTRGTIVAVAHASSNEVAAADEAHSMALDDFFDADGEEARAAAENARNAARTVLAEAVYAEALRIRDSQTASE